MNKLQMMQVLQACILSFEGVLIEEPENAEHYGIDIRLARLGKKLADHLFGIEVKL